MYLQSSAKEYQASIRVMGDGSTLEEHLTQPRAPGREIRPKTLAMKVSDKKGRQGQRNNVFRN